VCPFHLTRSLSSGRASIVKNPTTDLDFEASPSRVRGPSRGSTWRSHTRLRRRAAGASRGRLPERRRKLAHEGPRSTKPGRRGVTSDGRDGGRDVPELAVEQLPSLAVVISETGRGAPLQLVGVKVCARRGQKDSRRDPAHLRKVFRGCRRRPGAARTVHRRGHATLGAWPPATSSRRARRLSDTGLPPCLDGSRICVIVQVSVAEDSSPPRRSRSRWRPHRCGARSARHHLLDGRGLLQRRPCPHRVVHRQTLERETLAGAATWHRRTPRGPPSGVRLNYPLQHSPTALQLRPTHPSFMWRSGALPSPPGERVKGWDADSRDFSGLH
jgi:hypothetical protein